MTTGGYFQHENSPLFCKRTWNAASPSFLHWFWDIAGEGLGDGFGSRVGGWRGGGVALRGGVGLRGVFDVEADDGLVWPVIRGFGGFHGFAGELLGFGVGSGCGGGVLYNVFAAGLLLPGGLVRGVGFGADHLLVA